MELSVIGWFQVFFLILILQRMLELRIAKRNARRMEAQGGYEVGRNHYKYMVLIHMGFLLSLFVEVTFLGARPPVWWPFPFSILILLQMLRYWCIHSLGPYWNTRIYIRPGSRLVRKGLYRWIRHPNYWIVITEIAVIPLIFGAYGTAAAWSLINSLFLFLVRIPMEEEALAKVQTQET